MSNKYAFLDRDGTLIFEPADTGKIDSLERLQVLPGVIKGLQALKALDYRLVMVSNQNGIGTPSFPQADFDAPHQKFLEILKEHDIVFDAIFICPHMLEANCGCRKPKPGLLRELLATAKLAEASFVCGDRDTDRQLAKNIGSQFLPMEPNGNFYEAVASLI